MVKRSLQIAKTFYFAFNFEGRQEVSRSVGRWILEIEVLIDVDHLTVPNPTLAGDGGVHLAISIL